MGIFELLLFAVGLSMDACAVSICKGLAMKKATLKEGAICGAWFGGFQALMPLIGFFLGAFLTSMIEKNEHVADIPPLIAFVLLGYIGFNMLKEAFCKCEECEENGGADLSFKTMLVMAVATSIDALMVGVSFAMAGDVNIYLAVALIGIVTFALSCAGVKIGNVFGSRFEKKAQAAGGIILILLGLKILLEHLGVLG